MTLDLPLSPAPRVSVIVPAAASPELLLACLGSLAAHGPRSIPFETLVVLSGRPEIAAALERQVSGVRRVPSPVNLGLAGAGNRGRALARGELLLLLHDDSAIEPGAIEALVAAADAHPEAGAVGGKVLFPDGRLQSAGMILWRDGTTSPPWLGAEPAPAAFDRPRAVDYCGTSSLLVRAATWDAAGGLDERYFPVYYVDVDFGLAVRRLGQVVWYEPRSVTRHHRGASGDLRFRLFVTARNRQRLLDKWGSGLDAQEPPAAGSAAGIARALARAEAVAERCRSAGAFPEAGGGPAAPFDPDAQERTYYAINLELQKAYVRHLTAALAAHEEGRVEDGKAGRAWRLYQRLRGNRLARRLWRLVPKGRL